MDVAVNENIRLNDFRRSDIAALVEGLNDRDIYERTIRIPYPYTTRDAEEWLKLIDGDHGRIMWPVVGAIRDREERLIGSVGIERKTRPEGEVGELGYWLAKPFWGRGIMTAVVPATCAYTFATIELAKIIAHVFSFNDASARVLEKCGFEFEAYLEEHVHKDGRPIDVRLFSLAAPEAADKPLFEGD